MKILIILHSCRAEGTQIIALNLLQHWISEGHQAQLACLLPEPNEIRRDFEALGVPIHCFALGEGLLRFPRLLIQSFWLCRRWQPDAILSFPLGWHAFVAWGGKLAGVRHCCSHVGNLPPIWTGLAFQKFRLEVQLGRPVTKRLICCSNHVRKATIRDFKINPTETSTIYNACDLERIKNTKKALSRKLQSKYQLGVVGRLDENRDYQTLVQAIAYLKNQDFPVNLWMIGDGEARRSLEHLIATLELANHVEILGIRRDIPDLLTQLDLFVWPALALEGFGIALAEAMAAGVPIVATDVASCREVLDGGRCGLLVQPSNPKALAEGIVSALNDPEGSQQRAEAGQKRAQNHFTIEAMASAYGYELGLPQTRIKI